MKIVVHSKKISSSPSLSHLKAILLEVEQEYNRADFLYTDPIQFVHHFTTPSDQELAGAIASQLSYGNAKQILKALNELHQQIRTQSKTLTEWALFLQEDCFFKENIKKFASWKYRMNSGKDLVIWARILGEIQKKEGSLFQLFNRHFKQQVNASFRNNSPVINNAIHMSFTENALHSWTQTLLDSLHQIESQFPETRQNNVRYFLASPKKGSTCKRWCMFLRWMIRKDAIDLGIWTQQPDSVLKPEVLVIPIDTHLAKISRKLSLTSSKSNNWKTALEVTSNLKKIDPLDPVRFDFSLCRLGMLKKELPSRS